MNEEITTYVVTSEEMKRLWAISREVMRAGMEATGFGILVNPTLNGQAHTLHNTLKEICDRHTSEDRNVI